MSDIPQHHQEDDKEIESDVTQVKPSERPVNQKGDEKEVLQKLLPQTKQHKGEDSTQSTQTLMTPRTTTPEGNKDLDISIRARKTEPTQTGTLELAEEKKVVATTPNISKSSSSDSSDSTQHFSQDDINPPIMPIKLPGRKLDIQRKPSKAQLESPTKKNLLPKQRDGNIFGTATGTNDAAHRKQCFERQRRRARKANAPVVGRMKHKDFLKAVDRHRESRNVINCVCEPEKFGCFRAAQFYLSQAGHQTKSFCGAFCCPPWPKICFERAAFWPPNRGYYFAAYGKELPWTPQLVKKHKIPKAKRIITIEENVSMGLEHNCCDRIAGVETFIIQNSFKHFIAGFVAKPHRRIDAKLWIIYSHPNGSDLSDLMTLMPSPTQIADYLGANIIAYDYPGYGISTGKASEKTFYATIEAIIEYANATLGIPLESIVLWGYSIGTVCSVYAAMNHSSFAGCFLFAPVASIMRTLKSNTCFSNGKCEPKTNCLDSFSSLDMISRVQCPILIAHGEQDTLIPISHGQALLERATTTNSKSFSIWCKEVGHNNIPNSSELWMRVKHFLDHEINDAQNLRAKHSETYIASKKASKRRTRNKKKKHSQKLPPSSSNLVKTAKDAEEKKKEK